MPQPAPSFPESARTGKSFRKVRKMARTCSRAAVMSWTPPSRTGEAHSWMPDGVNRNWDVAAEAVRLVGVPPADLLAFPADGLFVQPVGGDDLAVQDQVGKPDSGRGGGYRQGKANAKRAYQGVLDLVESGGSCLS
jgi:hypothetical protein